MALWSINKRTNQESNSGTIEKYNGQRISIIFILHRTYVHTYIYICTAVSHIRDSYIKSLQIICRYIYSYVRTYSVYMYNCIYSHIYIIIYKLKINNPFALAPVILLLFYIHIYMYIYIRQTCRFILFNRIRRDYIMYIVFNVKNTYNTVNIQSLNANNTLSYRHTHRNVIRI